MQKAILIVDDNKSDLFEFEMVAKDAISVVREEIDVYTSDSLEKANKLLNERKFIHVFVDLNIPSKNNGLELITHPNAPFYTLLSGNLSDEIIRELSQDSRTRKLFRVLRKNIDTEKLKLEFIQAFNFSIKNIKLTSKIDAAKELGIAIAVTSILFDKKETQGCESYLNQYLSDMQLDYNSDGFIAFAQKYISEATYRYFLAGVLSEKEGLTYQQALDRLKVKTVNNKGKIPEENMFGNLVTIHEISKIGLNNLKKFNELDSEKINKSYEDY